MSPTASVASFDNGRLLDIDVDELRTQLRALRRQRKLSQSKVARLVYVSQATISAFEQGTHDNIRTETLRRIFEIVTFWHSGKGIESVSSRSIVAREEQECHGSSPCPVCHSHTLSPPSTTGQPTRPNPLTGVACLCGYVSRDPVGEYCSRCGSRLGESPLEGSEDPYEALMACMSRLADHHALVSRSIRQLQMTTPNKSRD